MKGRIIKICAAAVLISGAGAALIFSGRSAVEMPLSWGGEKYFWENSGYEFSIGMRAGHNPFEWQDPDPGLAVNPVLTGADVTDAAAGFVADPFMVREGGRWHMFFEVLEAETNRGVTSWAVSEDGFNWEYGQVVLEEPFHMSYPHVFMYEGEYMMIIESFQDDSVRLYSADPFPTGWKFEKRILSGEHVDNTIFEHGGRWWMMTGNRRNNVLRLYHAPGPSGPWEKHPESPIISGDPHTARPGGRVISWEGNLIRYPQDCYPTYGNAVHAFIIEKLDEEVYREKPWGGNPVLDGSGRGWNRLGMHHIDPHRLDDGTWLAVVDGYTRAQPDYRIKANFESGIRLLGFSVRPRRRGSGERFLLRLFWKDLPDFEGESPPAVFVHFRSGFLSRPVFQADHHMAPGREYHEMLVEIPEDTPPGEYEIWAGLYDPESGRRQRVQTGLKNSRNAVLLPLRFEVLK